MKFNFPAALSGRKFRLLAVVALLAGGGFIFFSGEQPAPPAAAPAPAAAAEPADDLLSNASRLVEDGLLQRSGDEFRLHPLLRDFLRER